MSLIHVEIKNQDGLVLRGYLNKPSNFNGTIVVMYHGFTGNKTEHGGIFKTFSRMIAQDGYASLRMDFSGNGESDGLFSQMTFKTLVDEATQFLQFAQEVEGVKKVLLLGFSMGGAIASIISKQYPDDLAGIILWAPAGNIDEIINRVYRNSPKLDGGSADYGGWVISKDLVASVNELDLYNGLDRFKKPCLVIHGSQDQSVNFSWGEKFANTYPQANFILVDKAPHGFNSVSFRNMLFTETLEFLKNI